METQIVKQKSPIFGSVLLIIGAVVIALSSIWTVISSILTISSALTLPDDYAIPFIISSVSTIASDLAHNLLGLMPILCIVIAIFAIIKKKGLPMLIASAVMTIFTVSGLFGTIGSVIMSYANQLTQIVSFSSFFEILYVLDNYILAPLTSLACAISLVIMWFMFVLLVLACADGKLGFLRKIKKVVGVLFTVSAIFVLVCFIGNLARYIAIDLAAYYAMYTTVYGVPLSRLINLSTIIGIVITLVNSLSTPLIALGLLSIGAWMKNPTVTVTAPEESVNDTAEAAAEESAETVPEESNQVAEAEITE